MHLTLHPQDAALVISEGWGERHPLAGCPVLGIGKRLLPEGFVMVYAVSISPSHFTLVLRVMRQASTLSIYSKRAC